MYAFELGFFFFGYVVALFVRFRLLSLITVNGVVEA